MNWNSQPPADATPLGTLGGISSGTWYEVDLSTLVTGDGQFGLGVSTPSATRSHSDRRKARSLPSEDRRRGRAARRRGGSDRLDLVALIRRDGKRMVDVSVDAADDVGVVSVDLLVDGQTVGTDTTAPYLFAWD